MFSIFLKRLSIIPAIALLSGPAPAQDNSLYILQDNSTGGTANTITVDQGAASGSDVGTFDAPAEQIGSGNDAELRIMGAGSQASLSQRSVIPTAEGNSVTLDLLGTNLTGDVLQTGSGNTGTLSASGTGASVSLMQDGDFNTGEVSVLGNDASGTLNQLGNRNNNALDVRGPGTSVVYNVIGNNLTSSGPPTVFSNGATVTITQTAPGGATQ